MGARFGGLLIDSILLGVVSYILAIVTTATMLYVFQIILGLLYWGYLVGTRGQTLGHQLVGIKVVDVNTGQPIGFGKAVVRFLVMDITGAIFTLGYWTPFFDSTRRQGWHDKSVGSVVIPAR
jgi:uncharacterized RDD family membrane protein YckC